MNDDQLQFDRTCHVIYSRPCKAEIREKIAHHYPESQREAVWERVQMQYVDFLSDWRTDLGGEKNFHNGPGGNYDCIALMAYYVVCRDVTSLQEIEEMEGNLFLPSFRRNSPKSTTFSRSCPRSVIRILPAWSSFTRVSSAKRPVRTAANATRIRLSTRFFCMIFSLDPMMPPLSFGMWRSSARQDRVRGEPQV